jgi:hypothetical protein
MPARRTSADTLTRQIAALSFEEQQELFVALERIGIVPRCAKWQRREVGALLALVAAKQKIARTNRRNAGGSETDIGHILQVVAYRERHTLAETDKKFGYKPGGSRQVIRRAKKAGYI